MSVIGIPGRRFGVGRTIPGQTNWQVYTARGIVLDVDTSAARFTGTPVYITSIGGNSSHWATTGATSVYRPDERAAGRSHLDLWSRVGGV